MAERKPWANSGRRAELPADWKRRIRPRILRRDGYRCWWGALPDEHYQLGTCPTRANQVDHVGDRHDHSDANLRSLCEHHHNVRTGRQGAAAQHQAKAAREALRKRPQEPHPGGSLPDGWGRRS